MPPSKLGYVVKWYQPSAPRRRAGYSGPPGPIYTPNDSFLGRGPHGTGAEYTIRACTYRVPLSEKTSRQIHGCSPGPKYSLPRPTSPRDGGVGLFSQSPRELTPAHEASPGPVYDVRKHMLPPPAILNGMGNEQRFHNREIVRVPGPGQYPLPATVGGSHASMPSQPVNRFSKGERSGRKHLALPGSEAPGPIYNYTPAVGKQVQSNKSNTVGGSWGKAKRVVGYVKQPERW